MILIEERPPKAATEATIYSAPFKEYIADLLTECLERTGHGEYEVILDYCEAASPKDTDRSEIPMEVQINEVYLWAKVKIYPCCMENWKDGRLRAIAGDVLHEICHMFLEPICTLFMWDCPPSQKDHYVGTVERQTERICKTLMRLMPPDWYVPKKKEPIV